MILSQKKIKKFGKRSDRRIYFAKKKEIFIGESQRLARSYSRKNRGPKPHN